MIGLVEHVGHGPTAIHRTFISEHGSGKAAVEPDKASLGPVAGGAVRLAQARAGQWLLVAEGLETTLSVMRACAMPGWAALSAGGIKSLVLPPSANMVVICADNDANGVGQRDANAAAERFLAEGRRVRIALPPTPGFDFNDLLCGSTSVRIDEKRHVA
jgi:putative DNA primase/helicase